MDIEICITTYNYIVCVHCCNLCIDSGRQNKAYKNVCYSASLNSRIFIRGVSFASNPPFFKRIRNFCFCTSSFFILVQSLNQRSVTLISKQSVEKREILTWSIIDVEMAATLSFRWLDILEKEFDKAFVDLDLLLYFYSNTATK